MARKTARTEPKKRVPATAAGQALGYSLQFTRLTAMLLDAPEGSTCSLEVLDDVSEQTADGAQKLSQTKSALTANPVADHAVSLWKTLSNWLELAKAGLISPERTVFELYVSRQVQGDLITAFVTADSLEQAKSALSKARDLLWGEAPAYSKKPKLPEGLSRYVNAVLGAEEHIVLPILVNLRLVCGSGSPQADIEAAIRRDPVSPSKVFDIANILCGWVKRQADIQLEKGQPAVIARDDFHREYLAYVRSVDRDLILKSFSAKPSHTEKLERFPDKFVQQLDLIEVSYDEKLEAISDFLRACSDRVLWSKSGDVHEDSFTELDDNLQRTWRNLRRAVEIEVNSKPEIERGKLLHARCMVHSATVQGMGTPAHFIPGCFHRLADDMKLGWHPAYRKQIETLLTATT